MSTKIEVGVTTKEEWDQIFETSFDRFIQDTRHAYYIRAVLNSNEKKILDIAAGNFRDTVALNEVGVDCFGCDFSSSAISLGKKQFPAIADRISEQDAFNIKFADKWFDLSFNVGFWVYFSNDDILKLMREQARVTKYRMIGIVHNAHNKQFVEYFDKMKFSDPRFNIRFFEMEEITELMKQVAKNVKIIPVGKGKKYYEDDLINIGLGAPEYIRKSFEYHGLKLLETSERLMCIGEV